MVNNEPAEATEKIGKGQSFYRKYFWKHLPKPEPIPPVPNPNKVDWSIEAVIKAKLDRDIKKVLGDKNS